MVRVLGRINGLLEPCVTLLVDTTGDPIFARRALANQAAAELCCELRVPNDDVTIFLQGGAAINVAHLKKDDQATVQSGEVWLLLDGPKKVIPAVVVGAFERISGALRPEVSCDKPILLKNAEALQLHLFGEEVSTTASGTTYRATGRDFTREARQLLHKLAAAADDSAAVSVESVRTERTLRLAPAAMTKLKALAADRKMMAVWKAISPGKKAAASGTAGSSRSVPISDAMRSAVAAAAARAVAASAAALAGSAVLH